MAWQHLIEYFIKYPTLLITPIYKLFSNNFVLLPLVYLLHKQYNI